MEPSVSISPGMQLAALSHGEDSPPPCSSVLCGGQEKGGLGASHAGTTSTAGESLKKQPQPAHKTA